MAPKFTKAATLDGYTTEKIDVIKNRLFGDYNANGIYVINKKVATELLELPKVKKDSFNNAIFCTAKTNEGRLIDFQIEFKKNSETGLAVAEIYVLEAVSKQGGRMSNILKTPIAKFTNEMVPDFVDRSLQKFNIISDASDDGRENKDVHSSYIAMRGALLTQLDKMTEEEYNVVYEDYFTQRINLLKQTNNAYTKKILAIFNEEFSKMSDYFLVDKKTKKVLNFKAMNELLDKAFEDLYGLDEYKEAEEKFKQTILPILTMFITGAERINEKAQKEVIKKVPGAMKNATTEVLVDIKQTAESKQKPEVKETNPQVISKEIKNTMEKIAVKVEKKQPVQSSTDEQIIKPEGVKKPSTLVEDINDILSASISSGAGKTVTPPTPSRKAFSADDIAKLNSEVVKDGKRESTEKGTDLGSSSGKSVGTPVRTKDETPRPASTRGLDL